MSGGAFILAINLSVAAFLAAAFVAIAIYDPARISARWLSASYALGIANLVLELAISLSGHAGVLAVAAYAAFLAAVVVFNVGLARLYRVGVPWRLMAVLFAAGVAVRLGIDGMARDSFLRMSLYQLPYALMQAIGVWVVWRARDKRHLEIILLVQLALVSTHYMWKPFIAAAVGGMGPGAEAYLGTTYAMYSQALGTVLVVGVALLLLVILVRNVLSDITTRSETDALSGLLNRRGFEERRDMAMRQKAVNGLPVSLVVADLDRFKAVNDNFGHAAGDRVIAAFGALVRRSVLAHQVAGRLGGEEFAILLPGANLATARLFAESLRTAFALSDIDTLTGHRFTASFGVAELRNGERAPDFEARADAALYAAKRGGRDRVEVATAVTPLRRASDRWSQSAETPPFPAP